MNLEEFERANAYLEKLGNEINVKQAELNNLRGEHADMWKQLKIYARVLGIQLIESKFVISKNDTTATATQTINIKSE